MGSLILNTKVAADPASVREVAEWLGRYAERVHDAATASRNARLHSIAAWDGPAGNAMRDDTADMMNSGDTLSKNTVQFKQGLEAFAAAIDTVRAKMGDARSKATAAGLKVTPEEIYPPAPAPPAPPMGGASSPKSPEDAQRMAAEHNAAMDQYNAAIDVVNRQTPVFNECRDLVADARTIEQHAHQDLDNLSTGVDGWVKDLKKISFFMAGQVLGTIKGTQGAINDLNRLSVELSDSAEVFNKIANGKYLTDADKTVLSAWEADSHAKSADMSTRAQSIERWVSKVPEGARNAIEMNPGSLIGDPKNIIGKGGKVILKGLPLVGTLVTVGSASLDVAMGQDLKKVAASTIAGTAGGIAGGWAGGALVGAIAGSEVPGAGTIIGGIVGGVIGTMAATDVVESSMGDG